MDFITINSRLEIKRDVLWEKKLKYDSTGFNNLMAFILVLLLFTVSVYRVVVEKDYMAIVYILITLIWAAPHIQRFYVTLFVKTWKSGIPISEIRDVITRHLDNGLETELILILNNGRKKFLVFRNAENQVEAFLKAIRKEVRKH